MRTEYKHNPPIPYSLHDMRVKKIIIQDKTISRKLMMQRFGILPTKCIQIDRHSIAWK